MSNDLHKQFEYYSREIEKATDAERRLCSAWANARVDLQHLQRDRANVFGKLIEEAGERAVLTEKRD